MERPMTDVQFDNLPLYAQRYIHKLERDLHSARHVAAVMDAGESEVGVRQMATLERTQLPPGSQVEFTLNPRQTVSCRVEDGELEVHAHQAIMVQPMSSNRCRIL